MSCQPENLQKKRGQFRKEYNKLPSITKKLRILVIKEKKEGAQVDKKMKDLQDEFFVLLRMQPIVVISTR